MLFENIYLVINWIVKQTTISQKIPSSGISRHGQGSRQINSSFVRPNLADQKNRVGFLRSNSDCPSDLTDTYASIDYNGVFYGPMSTRHQQSQQQHRKPSMMAYASSRQRPRQSIGSNLKTTAGLYVVLYFWINLLINLYWYLNVFKLLLISS